MKFSCCDERRLEVLRRSAVKANAIEFLEVLDRTAPAGVPRQRTLLVRLLRKPPTPNVLVKANLGITGGVRIPSVDIEWIGFADEAIPQAEPALLTLLAGIEARERTLVVRTTSAGDFSRYTFALSSVANPSEPPTDFDPLLSRVEFSFKVECPADLDCEAPLPCTPAPVPPPRIDYLAKDYAGFRRLMLDRLSLLAPGWTERSAADQGVALVELLAYVADSLSYRQDVIANEAYLSTARQRVSVRRHARLVDYYLHEGCNARAFVHLQISRNASSLTLPAGTPLFTQIPALPAVIERGTPEERAARLAAPQVFETVFAKELHRLHNQLEFYTWGNRECCLPRGATSATLAGHVEGLKEHDFLVFIELKSPTTLTEGDADRSHRHVVRVTRVQFTRDPVGKLFDTPASEEPAPITRIEWEASDALPFALCISTEKDPMVSVALGNIVLVEHGETQPLQDELPEELPPVPRESPAYAKREHVVGECCDPPEPRLPPLRFRPRLAKLPLTHGFPLAALLDPPPDGPQDFWSAAALRALEPRDAHPQVLELLVKGESPPEPWNVRRDLLSSAKQQRHCEAEIEDDGSARLRFGDDAHGKRPAPGTVFLPRYRVGNGAAGNVGADSIAHLLLDDALEIEAVRNPMAAFGGADPEDIESARRDAPQAFRTQQRAVTAADYAAAAERRGDVQRAAATFRWTGSWNTVFVTADRVDGAEVDDKFERGLRRHLERFRMAGYDLEVDAPRFVPLDIMLHVCVKPGYFRSHVLAAVRAALSSVRQPDGQLGAFHPDSFTFAQAVFASRVITAAQAVEGVESVRLDRFQRMNAPDPTTLDNGVIPMGRLEIAQLAADPNYRDRGRLSLSAGGGK